MRNRLPVSRLRSLVIFLYFCTLKTTVVNKQILRLAIPSIITNITVPLLGMVDVAIVGHIGQASYIAAIALATMVFNLIYWNFGFLRMGTSGLTAQAYGAGDREECLRILVRGLTIALAIALLLIALQRPIGYLCRRWIDTSEETLALTLTYFYIRIWAAPANLALYAIKGWSTGSIIPSPVIPVQEMHTFTASTTISITTSSTVSEL